MEKKITAADLSRIVSDCMKLIPSCIVYHSQQEALDHIISKHFNSLTEAYLSGSKQPVQDDWIRVEEGGMIEGKEYLTYTPKTENTIEGYRLITYGGVPSGFPPGVTHYKLPTPPNQ